jgi:hypothetical protein
MIGRQQAVGRSQTSWHAPSVNGSALGFLTCFLASVVAALALSASPALACPNEQLRHESLVNGATGQPYSAVLPDCRAYEMVSPLDKAGYDAKPVTTPHTKGVEAPNTFPIAPDGNAVGFQSVGAFAQPENNVVDNFRPFSDYISVRGETGWTTRQAVAPPKLIYKPFLEGFLGDFSPDLRTAEVSCGATALFAGVACAKRNPDGSWSKATQTYPIADGSDVETNLQGYLGGSADLSRVFIDPGRRLSSSNGDLNNGSFYEIAGVGTGSQQLRLVNIDNAGAELEMNAANQGTVLIGDSGGGQPPTLGTDYHAISQSGRTVFFTAVPAGGVQTVYARTHCEPGSAPSCKEDNEGDKPGEKSNEWLETVAVSSQSECELECEEPAPRPATFQGASANGSKVFFTTEQELLPHTEQGWHLYEYDFNKRAGHNLTQVSAGETNGVGAEVAGVVRTSSDGSHAYFIAKGVLTKTPNRNGEFAEEGQANLYGYDTETNETKFVAVVSSSVAGGDEVSQDTERNAQTTPDGRFLVFSTAGPPEDTGDRPLERTGDTNGTQPAVFRYDFQTEELQWVSHPAPELAPANEGKAARVTPALNTEYFLEATAGGAEAGSEDWSRQISGEAETEPDGEFKRYPGTEEYIDRYDGETLLFTTSEKLQAGAGGGLEVYEWHNGTVGMISAGTQWSNASALTLAPAAGMSASGSDVFFFTSTPLVGQDTDDQFDLYDARVDGGFPAPGEPSCSGEACQGTPTAPPEFGSAVSSSFPAGGNLPPSGGEVLVFKSTAPKPKLTRAQQLANALKACKKKRNKAQRTACESRARKAFGGKVKAGKTSRSHGRGK